MKILKIVFILIALGASNSIYCQNYLNETSKWYSVRGDLFDKWFRFSQLEIVGDTIVNNTQYYKLLEKLSVLQLDPFGSGDTLSYYSLEGISLIREDSGKIYSWAIEEDDLLIDFNLELGSIINLPGIDIEIIAIDSIQIGGEYRKVFHTNNGKKIYEGIGTNQGLREGLMNLGTEEFSKLKCFHQDGQTYELDSVDNPAGVSVTSCDSLVFEGYVNSINIEDSKDFKIYPNPSSDLLNIEFSGTFSERLQISVINFEGKEVIKTSTQQFINQIQLDISSLSKGIYVVIINKNKINYYKKIIKI